jgi:hypothetical protein
MNKSIRTLAMPLLLAGAVFASSGAHAVNLNHGADYYGTLDTGAAANQGRTVKIDANTRYVNVTDGDTVRFVSGGKSFTFTFNAWNNVDSVDLAALAPAGVSVPKVRVYIAQNPLYVG